ncbi:hypothetical protein [Pseudomonas simiae]|uniref:Uncharacterized protein n=1 Tax=Pseudomonas simiae TaxID=321846 RepID=U1UNA9_9PSED|nr:hypothetical protein [Pseudomonas simiae]ERH56542.1 hypothetical protein O204_05625 [Pseudomonas simiae]
MNNAQKLLIEKTLRLVGWAGVLITGAILIYAAFFIFTDPEYTAFELISDLLSMKAALLVWPPLVVGVVLLWLSEFVRAGRSS